jgi:hypothetical protein
MTVVVYNIANRDQVCFESVALAEHFLRSQGYTPRSTQPGQWVALRDDGNLFASLVS